MPAGAPRKAKAAKSSGIADRALQPTRVEDNPTLPQPPLAEEDDTAATDRPDFSSSCKPLAAA